MKKILETERLYLREMTMDDFEALYKEILQRDYNDSHREFAPLKQADDAVVIDTSYISAEEVADKIISVVKGK